MIRSFLLVVLAALLLLPQPGNATRDAELAPVTTTSPLPTVAELLARPQHRIPPRSAGAPTGSAFTRAIAPLDGRGREAAILEQALSGNVPSFLRQLTPVHMRLQRRGKRSVEATLWVTPDYFAIGSDADFVRTPVGLYTAAAIAEGWGMLLPTSKIVDAIHREAPVRLQPQPMRPGPQMTSTGYYITHHQRIEEQRRPRPLGLLTAGHKKDLVLTPRLLRRPGRVAIYGWHWKDGRPIQPLSTVHGARYADYSHGARLVSPLALVDGVPARVIDVLADPALCRLLSYEGPIPAARLLAAAASHAERATATTKTGG